MLSENNRTGQGKDAGKPTDFSGISARSRNTTKQNIIWSSDKQVFAINKKNPSEFKVYDISKFIKSLSGYELNKDEVVTVNADKDTKKLESKIKDDFRKEINKSKLDDKDIAITQSTLPDLRTDSKGKLKTPTLSKTIQQQIRELVDTSDLKKNGQSITLDNIVELSQKFETDPIKVDSAKSTSDIQLKQNPVYRGLLNKFIDNPGTKPYPLTLLNDVQKLKEYGFEVQQSIITDFGEVAGPVALLTNNANGNADRVLLTFLGAKNFNEIKEATIHFNSGNTDPLYDSFIEYNGRIVGISSKANGSAGTSITSLKLAIVEIRNNPIALKMLNEEILNKPDFLNAYKILVELVVDTRIMDNSNKLFNMLALVDKNYKNLDDDIKSLSVARNITKVNDIKLTNNFTLPDDWSFSDYINDKVKKYVSDRKTMKNKGAMDVLKRCLTTTIAKSLNQDPSISQLAVWILNHSATVQISTSTTQKKKGPIQIYNISAVWPSTAVDTVTFFEEDVDSPRFVLAINKQNLQFPDGVNDKLSDRDYPLSDGKAEFKDKFDSETKKKLAKDMAPTPQDLAIDSGNYYQSNTAQGIPDISTATDLETSSQTRVTQIAGVDVLASELKQANFSDNFITKVLKKRAEILKGTSKNIIPNPNMIQRIYDQQKQLPVLFNKAKESLKQISSNNPHRFKKMLDELVNKGILTQKDIDQLNQQNTPITESRSIRNLAKLLERKLNAILITRIR